MTETPPDPRAPALHETETTAEVIVAERFRGPTHSGNGGYVAGLLAEGLGPSAVVTLRRPVPLDAPLSRVSAGPRAALMQGEALLAEAAAHPGPDDAPGPVSLEQAEAASARPLVEDAAHGAPRCWVCGPLAVPHALHIRTGATRLSAAEGPPCAALWRPRPEHAAPDGLIEAVHLWGALDCPSGVAAATGEAGPPSRVYMLLGRITARIERRPPAGAPIVVTARPTGREGRKMFAESALHDADGRRLALARSIWIEVEASKLTGEG